jgi:L-lactate dehydrogenase (cytochrome)
MGILDPNSKTTSSPSTNISSSSSVKKSGSDRPPVSAMLNSFDFEAVARQTLKPEAWAYYSSGSDDELTLRDNHAAFHRIWLKPRVLVNVRVSRCDFYFPSDMMAQLTIVVRFNSKSTSRRPF